MKVSAWTETVIAIHNAKKCSRKKLIDEIPKCSRLKIKDSRICRANVHGSVLLFDEPAERRARALYLLFSSKTISKPRVEEQISVRSYLMPFVVCHRLSRQSTWNCTGIARKRLLLNHFDLLRLSPPFVINYLLCGKPRVHWGTSQLACYHQFYAYCKFDYVRCFGFMCYMKWGIAALDSLELLFEKEKQRNNA